MYRLKIALRQILLVFAVALVLGTVMIYAFSEYRLKERFATPPSVELDPGDGNSIEGRRLVRVFGCADCHSPDLTGRLMEDKPGVIKVVSPNLTLSIPRYSNSQFAAAVRQGIRADGTGLLFMPSSKFQWLNDAELSDMLAYLRPVPPKGSANEGISWGPVARVAVAAGEIETGPRSIKKIGRMGPVSLPGFEEIRRLAIMTCGECHGADLTGSKALQSPDLAVVAAYSAADFSDLLRTGKAMGGRELRMMSEAARARYAYLTDEEIEGLQSYLVARAAMQVKN